MKTIVQGILLVIGCLSMSILLTTELEISYQIGLSLLSGSTLSIAIDRIIKTDGEKE